MLRGGNGYGTQKLCWVPFENQCQTINQACSWLTRKEGKATLHPTSDIPEHMPFIWRKELAKDDGDKGLFLTFLVKMWEFVGQQIQTAAPLP